MADQIHIYFFNELDIDLNNFAATIEEVNRLQDSYSLVIKKDIILELNPDETQQPWDYLSSVLEAIDNKNYKIGILSAPIENNWFSNVNHAAKVSYITTNDWIYLSELPVYAYLLYEIFQNYQEMRLNRMIVHSETKGCINDMCGYKLDLNFKIKMGWVCQDCMMFWKDVFNEQEIKDFNIVLDHIRFKALERDTVWQIYKRYPAPIAVRFKLMQAETNSYIKFQKLIELYDAIVRYTSFTILSIISNDDSAPKSLKKNKEKVMYGNPSVHTWEELIKCYSNINLNDNDLLTENDLRSIEQISNVCVNEEIRQTRNDYRGHNYTGQNLEEFYQQYLKNIEAIHSLLTLCEKSIFRLTLVKVDNFRPVHGVIELTYRSLMGDSMVFETMHIEVNNTPHDANELLLLDECNGNFVSVHPYVKYAICCECQHERILFRDGQYSDNAPRYIDTLMGHRTKCR